MSDSYDRAALEARLTEEEGYRSKPYFDTRGQLTVGVGHNLTAKGLPPSIIQALLDYDVSEVEAQLDQAIPWWRTLDAARQNILMDMGFQLGVSGLLQFKALLGCLQDGDWAGAKAAMLDSLWAKETPARANTLAAAMETGVLPK